jgi:hypothetical protein
VFGEPASPPESESSSLALSEQAASVSAPRKAPVKLTRKAIRTDSKFLERELFATNFPTSVTVLGSNNTVFARFQRRT